MPKKMTLQGNKVSWNPHLIPSDKYFTESGRLLLLRLSEECKNEKVFTFVWEALDADIAGKNIALEAEWRLTNA